MEGQLQDLCGAVDRGFDLPGSAFYSATITPVDLKLRVAQQGLIVSHPESANNFAGDLGLGVSICT